MLAEYACKASISREDSKSANGLYADPGNPESFVIGTALKLLELYLASGITSYLSSILVARFHHPRITMPA